MSKVGKWVVAALAMGSLAAIPNVAQANTSESEQLRRLDIMLMVTSLRCRRGADDFQDDYYRFASRHVGTLRAASQDLSADYQRRHGTRAARRYMDTMSTSMANQYGLGHPWMGCAELGAAARNLADTSDRQQLLAAANEFLAERRPAARDTLLAAY